MMTIHRASRLFSRENEVFSPMRAGDFIEYTLEMFGNNNQIIQGVRKVLAVFYISETNVTGSNIINNRVKQ